MLITISHDKKTTLTEINVKNRRSNDGKVIIRNFITKKNAISVIRLSILINDLDSGVKNTRKSYLEKIERNLS